jgi:FMN phosphatase YigB (HAD superfamily)
MIRPDAVIFDLGKVLVDFDYSIVGRRVAARGRLSAAEVQRLIDHAPLLLRYETGAMSREEFFGAVRAATGYEGTIEEFGDAFADIFTPIPRMVELHAELRRRRVPAFIFSNTNDLAVAHIRGSFPFFSDFDGYVLSYEQGAMKPDERIYEVVERMTGLRGEQLLYLDDRPENVATGAARGWQTIQHSDPEQTWERVRALGLI